MLRQAKTFPVDRLLINKGQAGTATCAQGNRIKKN
jgi:hypothetical protein